MTEEDLRLLIRLMRNNSIGYDKVDDVIKQVGNFKDIDHQISKETPRYTLFVWLREEQSIMMRNAGKTNEQWIRKNADRACFMAQSTDARLTALTDKLSCTPIHNGSELIIRGNPVSVVIFIWLLLN